MHELPDIVDQQASYTFGSIVLKAFNTEEQIKLVRLWCFGERFFIPKLQNAAMESLLHLLRNSYIRAETIMLSIQLTPDSSLLRKAVVREFVGHSDPNSPNNNYGGHKYENAEKEQLDRTPGLLHQSLVTIASSRCRSFPCICDGGDCYYISDYETKNYMLTET